MPDDTANVRAEALQMSRDLVTMIDSQGEQMTETAAPQDAEPASDTKDEGLDESPYLFAALADKTLDDIEEIGSRKRPEAINGLRGIQTGFTDLDALTGGLTAGTLTVIASRPAMGRTTLACDFARHAAIKCQQPAGFLTMQESLTRAVTRVKSAEARIMRHRIYSGTMTEEDWTRLARRLPDMTASPLYLRHMSTPGLVTLALEMKDWVEADRLKLLVVDGIEEIGAGLDNRTDTATVVNTLKALAVELDIPVVATAQTHRRPGDPFGKVPHTDDLHEAVAFVADTVIMVHRDDAYEANSPRAGEADLIVAKHRNGPTAIVTTAFQGHYSRFVDMAQT
ncbi:DnaB-like helicase C-terminal domain-containing protein [Streptomyces scabiei]|uniref:replicative DNA helicase n=1 Tax=Streptomyces scabiei TaxID=1930 RepID=UPI0029A58517|nr:DnaB-like helicase C-terminal domain-containing protein [Streptomyces scabiei]MDX3174187.1 DnaB-like helicase C-terminal domain-containing protein [Streptomyces scabiei]